MNSPSTMIVTDTSAGPISWTIKSANARRRTSTEGPTTIGARPPAQAAGTLTRTAMRLLPWCGVSRSRT